MKLEKNTSQPCHRNLNLKKKQTFICFRISQTDSCNNKESQSLKSTKTVGRRGGAKEGGDDECHCPEIWEKMRVIGCLKQFNHREMGLNNYLKCS